MNTTPNTETTTPVDSPAGTTDTTASATFLNQHRKGVVVAAVIALLALIAAAIGIPALVTTIGRANADADYQKARIQAVAQYRADLRAQKDFTTAHTEIAELNGQVGSILAATKPGEYLPGPVVDNLAAEHKQLVMYAGFKAGTAAVDPHPAGTPSSTTAQLQKETTRLKTFVNDHKAAHETTVNGAKGITAQAVHTTKQLTTIITGLTASKAVTAIPALDVTAQDVLANRAKAGQPEKDQLAAAAAAALDGIKDGKAPGALLLDYLAKAKTVSESHDAAAAAEIAAAEQAAAEAAARAGQNTYTDPSTGQTKTTPRSNSGGGSNGGGSSSGGAGGGGGGSSSGGGTPSGGSPAPSGPTLRVITDGDYRGSCAVGQVVESTDWRLGMTSGQITWHGPGAGVPWSYSQSGNTLTIWLCA